MPRLLLHAGLPKTGSTSIQQFLAANRAALRDQAFFYEPTADRRSSTNHNFLAMAFWTRVQRMYSATYGDDVASLQRASRARWDEMLRAFRRSDAETLIVSGEHFTRARVGRLADFARAELAEFDVTILFYLRRPSELYVSWTQQQIKGSNRLIPVSWERARWATKLRNWRDVGDVVLREFHRDALVGRDAVADFCAVAGIDAACMERPADANETISAEGMELVLSHRRFHFPDAGERILPETNALIEQIRGNERAVGRTVCFTRPTLFTDIAEYVDSDAKELEQLERSFGFTYAGLEPQSLRPEHLRLEDRLFDTIGDMMPVDIEAREWLRHRLEAGGARFAATHTPAAGQ